jgi:excisionase family DNA binding protein
MKIYKITEASEYLGVSINTLKTLANNGKINSFKTTGSHRRFRQEVFSSQWETVFTPRTDLGKRLYALRAKAVVAGMKLFSEEEVLEEVKRRRGELVKELIDGNK